MKASNDYVALNSLCGKGIPAILEEREREDFDLLQAAHETRETVVRTRQGQTIPVSLTGSQIASDDPQFQGNIFVADSGNQRTRGDRSPTGYAALRAPDWCPWSGSAGARGVARGGGKRVARRARQTMA